MLRGASCLGRFVSRTYALTHGTPSKLSGANGGTRLVFGYRGHATYRTPRGFSQPGGTSPACEVLHSHSIYGTLRNPTGQAWGPRGGLVHEPKPCIARRMVFSTMHHKPCLRARTLAGIRDPSKGILMPAGEMTGSGLPSLSLTVANGGQGDKPPSYFRGVVFPAAGIHPW